MKLTIATLLSHSSDGHIVHVPVAYW